MCLSPGKGIWLTFFYMSAVAITAPSVYAQELDTSCRVNLSEKARTIYDKVVEKSASALDLEESWKEVARDMITENKFGREDATAPAIEAYACLKKENM